MKVILPCSDFYALYEKATNQIPALALIPLLVRVAVDIPDGFVRLSRLWVRHSRLLVASSGSPKFAHILSNHFCDSVANKNLHSDPAKAQPKSERAQCYPAALNLCY